MPILNIRIVELITKEKRSTINYLYSLVHLNDSQNKRIKMKITTNKRGNVLLCKKPISFNIESQSNNSINIDFKRHRMFIADDHLGKLILPLDWFPTNHVVREWFPITKQGRGKHDAMILLDIHIDNRNVDPFMAPFATMKVIPSWRRPEFSENAEVPVNPPIVFIVSSQPQYFVISPQSNDGCQNNSGLPPHQEIYQVPYYFGNQQSISMPNLQLMPLQNQMNSSHVDQHDAQQQNTNHDQQVAIQAFPLVVPAEIQHNNNQTHQEQISQQSIDPDDLKLYSSDYPQQNFNAKNPKNSQIIHQNLLDDEQEPMYYPSLPQNPYYYEQNIND